jgi:hypothetical protein
MKMRTVTTGLLVIVLALGLFAVPAMASGHDVYPPTPPVTPPPVTPPVTPPAPPSATPPQPTATPPAHPITGVNDVLFLVLAGGALLGLGVVAVRGVKRPVRQG